MANSVSTAYKMSHQHLIHSRNRDIEQRVAGGDIDLGIAVYLTTNVIDRLKLVNTSPRLAALLFANRNRENEAKMLHWNENLKKLVEVFALTQGEND